MYIMQSCMQSSVNDELCASYTAGQQRWSLASPSDAEAGSREMVCPICRDVLKPSDAQTHLILEFSQLKQLVNT